MFALFVSLSCAFAQAPPPAAVPTPSAATKPRPVFSRTIGQVGESVFTSREAALSGVIDRVMTNEKDPGGPTAADSQAGKREQSQLLLEEAVSREAASFAVAAPTQEEIAELVQKTEKHIAGRADWKKLGFGAKEIHAMVERKLGAKNLIRIRSESMKGSISDSEAQTYFEKNRVKFGSLPFASFKDNIKKFLAQQQLEDRLRSWFEILRRKYNVREDQGGELRG